MSNKGWIGVDLDGTLAIYDGWKGALEIGEPIKPMVERVKQWVKEGKNVKIFTARVTEGPSHNKDGTVNNTEEVRKAIEDWCNINLGFILPITNLKDFDMIQLWDDRAVQVIPNLGISVQELYEM